MSAAEEVQRARALLVARGARELADGLKANGHPTFAELADRFRELGDVVIDLLGALERERRERGATR